MHRTRAFRVTLVLLASTVAVVFAFADAAALRLRPEKGKTYRYVMVQKQDMTMSMGALGSQQSTNTTTMDLRQTATDVAASGDITFDVVYDRVRVNVAAGPQSTSFDSAAESATEADKMVGLLVGKNLSMTMTERGQVTRLEGLTEILDEALGDAAQDAEAAPLIKMMRGSFSDESMVALFQQNSAILPDGPVTEGTQWSHASVIDNPALGQMQVAQDYVVAGFEDKLGRPCVKTGVKIAMVHDGDVPMIEEMEKMISGGGQEVDMSVEVGRSDGSGTVWLDRETGMTVAMDTVSTMDMSMSFAMPGMEEAPGGGAMTMKIAMIMGQTIELQPDEAAAAN